MKIGEPSKNRKGVKEKIINLEAKKKQLAEIQR